MRENEQNFTPENAAEQPPPVEAAASGETASSVPQETPEEELQRLERERVDAQVKLAWEKKQAGELVKEAYEAHQEAGPALDDFELDIKTGLKVQKVPEVPEKMGQMSEREQAAVRQRRADISKQAETLLFDLANINLTEYLHGEKNPNAKSAVPDAAYDEAAKKLFEAETKMDLLQRGRGRYRKSEDPDASMRAFVEKNQARLAMAETAGRIMAKGDANAWYLWKRECLRDRMVNDLKSTEKEKRELIPEDEKKLRELDIDPEALYRSRTEDAAERAGDKEKKYRLPLRHALSPSTRRLITRYVAGRDAMNRGLDEAASMSEALEDHEGLWQVAQKEHEKLIGEASAEAKPGTGRRIEFETPELAERYAAVVDELLKLEKTFSGVMTPDQRQAKYKLGQLIAAKLPNLPGLRLQALADAQEKLRPKTEATK